MSERCCSCPSPRYLRLLVGPSRKGHDPAEVLVIDILDGYAHCPACPEGSPCGTGLVTYPACGNSGQRIGVEWEAGTLAEKSSRASRRRRDGSLHGASCSPRSPTNHRCEPGFDGSGTANRLEPGGRAHRPTGHEDGDAAAGCGRAGAGVLGLWRALGAGCRRSVLWARQRSALRFRRAGLRPSRGQPGLPGRAAGPPVPPAAGGWRPDRGPAPAQRGGRPGRRQYPHPGRRPLCSPGQPGRYQLVTLVRQIVPRCPAVTMTVTAGQHVRANIHCDSGIR